MGMSVVCLLPLLALSVGAITNGDLYDALKENLIVLDDSPADADVTLDNSDDTIYFPGNENDEVDTDFLIEKLGLKDLDLDDVTQDGGQIVGGCSCSRHRCSCCTSKTFSARILWKRVKARISACVTLEYLPSNLGFKLTFVVNGKTMFNREISLKHPPALCYTIPGTGRFARICLEIYNVDLGRKSLCTKVTGVIDLKVKKWRYSIKLACFRIPTAEDRLEVVDDDTILMTSQDDNLADLFRMLKNGEINMDDLALE